MFCDSITMWHKRLQQTSTGLLALAQFKEVWQMSPTCIRFSLSVIWSCSPARMKMTVRTSSKQMDHVRGEKHAAFKGNELLKPLKDHFSLYYAERVYNDWAQGSSLREDSQQNLWCFVDRIQTVHHNQMHRHVRRVNLQLQGIELPHSEERKLFLLAVFSLASTVSCESTNTHRRRTMPLNMHVFEKDHQHLIRKRTQPAGREVEIRFNTTARNTL